MLNDWILEVLSDLKCFADQNGLALLAHQLETTKQVAEAEITEVQQRSAQPIGAAPKA